MNSHIQLNEAGEFLRYIPAGIPIEWDENNYCTVLALIADGKAEQFQVVTFFAAAKPEYDPITQVVSEIDPVLVEGNWAQQWQVTELSPEQIAANRKALVPASVTRRKACQALLLSGITKEMVTTALQNIPDPLERGLAMIEWEDSLEFERNRPLVAAVGTLFGLTDEQLDELFITAGNLP